MVKTMRLHESACILIYHMSYNVYLCFSMYDPTDIISCYDYDVKLKRDLLRELMFSKFLKLNLCMSTIL